MVSAVANGPKTVALYAEKTAEIKTLKIGSWIKDRILLVDLGFYKTQLFARVEENGGYFVSRIKKNMDPVIVSIEEGVPKTKRNEFIGKTLNECIEKLSGKDIDAIVKIAFICIRLRDKMHESVIFYAKISTFKLENHYTWYSKLCIKFVNR